MAYGYRSIEMLDLKGRKLADLVETQNFASLQPAPSSSLPVIDLSSYPTGTYLVKINFERGVSVVRKVVNQLRIPKPYDIPRGLFKLNRVRFA